MSQSATFQTPFSRAYWKLACSELKSVRILVLAAMITALRIAVKSLNIPLGPDLFFSVSFFFNAIGAMIYGPVVGLLTGAVSDTLGYLISPGNGPYFFPFIFSEMMGSFLLGLFLYRAKLSTGRVILSRFTVTLLCNLILDPLLLYWQYSLMGRGYTLLSLHRIIKNITLFPAQCLLLIVLLGAIIPLTARFKLTYTDGDKLKVTKRHIIGLVILTILSAAVVLLFYFVYLPNR